jgi:hypothetical protein
VTIKGLKHFSLGANKMPHFDEKKAYAAQEDVFVNTLHLSTAQTSTNSNSSTTEEKKNSSSS